MKFTCFRSKLLRKLGEFTQQSCLVWIIEKLDFLHCVLDLLEGKSKGPFLNDPKVQTH